MDRRGAASPVGSILMAGLAIVLAVTILVSAQGVASELDQSRGGVDRLLGNETATGTVATSTPATATSTPATETSTPASDGGCSGGGGQANGTPHENAPATPPSDGNADDNATGSGCRSAGGP